MKVTFLRKFPIIRLRLKQLLKVKLIFIGLQHCFARAVHYLFPKSVGIIGKFEVVVAGDRDCEDLCEGEADYPYATGASRVVSVFER